MARCAICGQNRKLTKDHVPLKSAYNDTPLLLYHMIVYTHHDRKYMKGTTSTGAFVKETICEDCNNHTGAWYGSAYADFTKQMAHYADRCPSGEVIVHPNSAKIYTSLHIYPARVIKQALCMFCVTCETRLADEHPNMYPEIRKRILDKYSRGKIGGLKLWLYIRSVHGGMLSGLLRLYNTHRSIHYSGHYSEVSFWPAGWVMTLNGKEMPKLCEVTHWLEYDYDDKDNVWVLLPHGERTFNRGMPDPTRLSDS